jgi:mercuric ion transport protein
MSRSDSGKQILQISGDTSDQKGGLLALGGVISAILASTCCVVPLLFVLLGISSAWIVNLTALELYKPYFAAGALVFIGLGFWQAYFRAQSSCMDGAYCAKPQSAIITKTALWLATLVVLLALTINWWAPLFY